MDDIAPLLLLEDFDWISNLLELFKKYVQKRKLRANLLKTKIITSQGAKESFDVV
jgi:hypothetical protein